MSTSFADDPLFGDLPSVAAPEAPVAAPVPAPAPAAAPAPAPAPVAEPVAPRPTRLLKAKDRVAEVAAAFDVRPVEPAPAPSAHTAQIIEHPVMAMMRQELDETQEFAPVAAAAPAPHHVAATTTPPIHVGAVGDPQVGGDEYDSDGRVILRQGPPSGASLDAYNVSAWFGTNKVLNQVSLAMPPSTVTALIGPSGCGKSTFLRILNRMHESVPSAQLAGEVHLNGEDIYAAGTRLTDTRKKIGMVFQKPNPFPTMTIAENVTAGLKLTGTKIGKSDRDDLIEQCLTRGGLWREVKDRLDSPGGALSGGQQQRLCIARSLAVNPAVLLMDEPCSALDPTSTLRIEETIVDLMHDITIVIVTHNMQQAARVSQHCAFFLAEQGKPGVIVEAGKTKDIFGAPKDPRTADYVNGRFG